jgi:hypothetical protein
MRLGVLLLTLAGCSRYEIPVSTVERLRELTVAERRRTAVAVRRHDRTEAWLLASQVPRRTADADLFDRVGFYQARAGLGGIGAGAILVGVLLTTLGGVNDPGEPGSAAMLTLGVTHLAAGLLTVILVPRLVPREVHPGRNDLRYLP